MADLAEQVTDVCTHHGEGPVWDAAHGVLRFVDMSAGGLMTLDPASGQVSRRTVGTVAACIRPRTNGGLVVALQNNYLLLDDAAASAGASAARAGGGDDGGTATPSPEVWADPSVRFNDGGCDPQGRFYCGTMAFDATPGRGSVYRLDADGSVTSVLTGVTISNGLWFAPDGTYAYYADTATGRIDVIEADPVAGTFGERRPFVEIPEETGAPDGLTVDSEGGVWVALWGGSAVHRYSPEGKLDAVVRLPASQVSCPAFGGDDLGDLYVTTSRENLPDDAEPRAGAIYRVRPGVAGMPVLPYAG
jgi:sugar lactone lactonase YvrE